ncbi:MAG TPA: Clp protease N-terminal domain-containing protein [Acidimicrobiales bacterium]|nr:Clp protease N-terminal domain-containing protein [Acidimicrobiales bacterium]
MFERFTDKARRVVVLAQEESHRLGHNHIGVEHVLVALVHDDESLAGGALADLGVDLPGARAAVEDLVGRGDGTPSGHIPFTPAAKRTLELSLREALSLGHSYIGTEHLLLGLVKELEAEESDLLPRLDLSPAQVRQAVTARLTGGQVEEEPSVTSGRLTVTSASTPWPAHVRPTSLAASVMSGVSDEATRRRHPRMGSEHLLLWLLSRPDGGAMRALRAEGVEVAALRRRLEQMLAEAGDSTDP